MSEPKNTHLLWENQHKGVKRSPGARGTRLGHIKVIVQALILNKGSVSALKKQKNPEFDTKMFGFPVGLLVSGVKLIFC